MEVAGKLPEGTTSQGGGDREADGNMAEHSSKLEAAENIIISMEGDKKNSVSGMAHLTPSTLVLADFSSKRVSVLDTNTNTIQARLTLSSGPWDVVALTSTEVAVTLPNEKAIQIVAFHYGALSKVRRFKMSGHCIGIDCYKNNLVVSYVHPGKVEIIDTQGHVQKVFEYKDDLPDSCRVFSDRPGYAIFTRNGEALLVSDYDNHTITKLCTLGHVLTVYDCKPNRLVNPQAMCMCADGSVLVCGAGSHNIQLLSRDGDFICEILGKEDGLEFPASLALSGDGNMLYVGSSKKNYIQAFRIKYK